MIQQRLETNSKKDIRLEDFMDDEYMEKVANDTKSLTTNGFIKSNSAKDKYSRHSILSHILSKSNAMNTELEIAEESNEHSIGSKDSFNKF